MYSDNNKPRGMDIVFIIMAACACIALWAMLGSEGGSTTVHGNVSNQYNVGSVVNNGVVGSNTTQQIAPTPPPQWSTDSVGNPVCWDSASRMYIYACGGKQP